MRISFEASSYCNAKCVFCPQSQMKRKRGEMSDELFHKIIKEGKELNAQGFYPFLNGEPFVFPKIYKWLDYMEKEKVNVYLYTNADRMNVDRILKYTCIRTINCSLNATTKKTHKKLMRGPNFRKAVRNTKKLIAQAKNFRVRVSMIELPENASEKEDFKKTWGSLAKFCFCKNWLGYNNEKNKDDPKIPCYYLRNYIAVLWDGRVALCCMDYEGKVIIGDLNKESLRDIWTKLAPLRKRQRYLDFDMPLCRDCNVNIA